ncbi:MAG: hypothetical protein LAO79_17045, partial [Acidobacteriia bacterium]|nr:hypothetical protein [Terriglobia bacterium]
MDKRTTRIVLPGLLLYFLYFAIPAINSKWAPDDPMNLRYYWNRGFWKCLADIVNFWSGGYRPMGAVFYLPIYQWARLSPVPYRIAILLVIAGV